MRGEDVACGLRVWLAWWITPACAGKTAEETSQTHRRKDHPRMRGEDSTSL